MSAQSPRRPREAAVVVCSDAGWAWQSAFVLARSIANDLDGRLDHHAYLIGDVSNELMSAFPAEVSVHRLQEYTEQFAYTEAAHIPKATMLRFFAIEELSRVYRRVIYVDGDVYQAWGSFADLLTLGETEHALAAVRDRSQWFDKPSMRGHRRYIAALNPKIGSQYFNAGFLVVNGPVYSARECSAAALAFYRDNPERCRFGDQSALNAVIAGAWDSLSPGWNWQMSSTSYPLTAGRRPRHIHFTGPMKPWNDRLRLFDPSIFDEMKVFLKQRDLLHVLDHAKSPDGFRRARERRRSSALEYFSDGASVKREMIKEFLDLPTHVDTAAGLVSYDL